MLLFPKHSGPSSHRHTAEKEAAWAEHPLTSVPKARNSVWRQNTAPSTIPLFLRTLLNLVGRLQNTFSPSLSIVYLWRLLGFKLNSSQLRCSNCCWMNNTQLIPGSLMQFTCAVRCCNQARCFPLPCNSCRAFTYITCSQKQKQESLSSKTHRNANSFLMWLYWVSLGYQGYNPISLLSLDFRLPSRTLREVVRYYPVSKKKKAGGEKK